MDIENLLKLLQDRKVRFVIVGASAFPVHGYSRATADFDIFIASDEENVRMTREALSEFGYDLTDFPVNLLQQKKLLIREYYTEVDIHPFITGVNFESIWEHKVSGSIEDQPAYFASLDDLIMMKKAAGRPKDLLDLEILERLKLKKNKATP